MLKTLGLPRGRLNERSALTLLALLGLEPETPWSRSCKSAHGHHAHHGFLPGPLWHHNARRTTRNLSQTDHTPVH